MKEKLIEKIAKLLAKAEGAQEVGSLQEAEVFTAKVNKLLIKHNLSMSAIKDINLDEEKFESSEDLKGGIKYGTKSYEGLWEIDLASTIAKNNFCKVLFRSYRNVEFGIFPTLNFIGKKQNVEVCGFLFEFLSVKLSEFAPIEYFKAITKIRDKYQVIAIETEDKYNVIMEFAYKYGVTFKPSEIIVDYDYPKDSIGQRKFVIKDPSKLKLMTSRSIWIKSFLKGGVIGIYRKMLVEKEKQFTSTEQDQINALVRVEDAAISKYIEENIDVKGKVSSNQGGGIDGSAVKAGERVGYGIALSKGVEGQVTNRKELL